MGKLIAFEWMSLNGVFDADTMDQWWAPYDSSDRQQCIQDTYLHTDAFLMGRVSYEMLAPYWSQLADDEQGGVAGKLNHTQKYVVSGRPPRMTWQNSAVVSEHGEDAEAAIRKVKDERAETVIIGSGTLVASLMRASLIDEYKFLVQPVIAGRGKRLFADDVPTGLRLATVRELDQGVLFLQYERSVTSSRKAPDGQ